MSPSPELALRPFQLEDAPEVARLLNDESVSKWTLTIPFPYSVQDAKDWITETASGSDRHPFAVELKGSLVACVSFWPHQPTGVEVGYWVGREYRGAGVCTAALLRLMASDHFPSGLDVYAKVMVENIASKRVLENCGFSFLEKGSCTKDGCDVAADVYVRRSAT